MIPEPTTRGPTKAAGRFLIVEDDYFTATDLSRSFEKAGAEVIGPVPTVEEAAELLRAAGTVDGAVLDINLEGGGLSYPLADELVARGTPFVFATGYEGADIPARFSGVKRFEKPCRADQILQWFAEAH